MKRFSAEIKQHEGIDGAYVEIPFDVEEEFGSKRVKVKARFDGAEYRGSIVRMGGCFMIGITQVIRSNIGKKPGDTVEVFIEKDEEERTVEAPEDFSNALNKSSSAKAFFETLSFSNKREYMQWVTGAKREDTRTSRIEKAVQMLSAGKRLK